MTILREAAKAVLDRWDSSEHAASDLFEELRAALEQPKGLFIDMIAAHGPEFVEEVRRVGENIEQPEQQAEPVAHLHEWFRTGAMEPGKMRCIHCGASGNDASLTTSPQQQTEPVAWVFAPNNELLWPSEVEVTNPIEIDSYQPLYTSPPQRKPLTKGEIEIILSRHYMYMEDLIRAVEAAHGIKGEA